MKREKGRRKSKHKQQNQCVAREDTKIAEFDEVEEEAPRRLESWNTVCYLYGREWDGCTHYFSKRVDREGFAVMYDWESSRMEVRLVPQPYGTCNDDPDFLLQIRPLLRGEQLQLDYVTQLANEEDDYF